MAITLQDYSLLREVQSLDIYVKTHLDKIAAEHLRTEQICQLRQKRTEQRDQYQNTLDELKQVIALKEKELFSLEANLKQAKTNLSVAANASQMETLEKQIAEGISHVDKTEDETLNLLSQSEELEELIEVDNQFLAGSLKTLNEIEKEVLLTKNIEQKEIDKYEERINKILLNISEPLVKAFQQARSKHRFSNPITKIKAKSCMMCRFILDSQTSSQVELFKSIEFCGQCDRLIAPLEA